MFPRTPQHTAALVNEADRVIAAVSLASQATAAQIHASGARILTPRVRVRSDGHGGFEATTVTLEIRDPFVLSALDVYALSEALGGMLVTRYDQRVLRLERDPRTEGQILAG